MRAGTRSVRVRAISLQGTVTGGGGGIQQTPYWNHQVDVDDYLDQIRYALLVMLVLNNMHWGE